MGLILNNQKSSGFRAPEKPAEIFKDVMKHRSTPGCHVEILVSEVPKFPNAQGWLHLQYFQMWETVSLSNLSAPNLEFLGAILLTWRWLMVLWFFYSHEYGICTCHCARFQGTSMRRKSPNMQEVRLVLFTPGKCLKMIDHK
jgi:hypothetical protein